MSTYLWKYYFENDVEKFRQVLANATYNTSAVPSRAGYGGFGGNIGAAGSPGTSLATSPTLISKSRRSPGWSPSVHSPAAKATKSSATVVLSRADINSKDGNGVTLLHYIASSTDEKASQYASELLQVPLLDLYIQDVESGWTALHRALYFGNITIARALMDRDGQDVVGHHSLSTAQIVGGLIKIKDREGNSPFDVYGASITNRIIRRALNNPLLASASEEENDVAHGVSGDNEDGSDKMEIVPKVNIEGDELFTFGSNKNFTLGFGDEDDRQFPERITLKRADHLLRRLHAERQPRNPQSEGLGRENASPASGPLPALIQYRPIIIQDVQLSKFHSAVITSDPEANLHMCGFGSGGRLGTGDESTRFHFVSIYGGGLVGKRVVHVGLGQNHTIAISSEGELFTWGNNTFGQLGYTPPTSTFKDDEHPIQLLPRQVFGPLKRETVIGSAASRTHSVVNTSSSLYTFGKNDGQLGLVDSDARSLAIQSTPRKVAASLFSSSIASVSAIDRATICLLENHDVWIFANYGYTKMSFPLEGFSNYFLKSTFSATRYSTTPNSICKVTSGGDTICVMSTMGDVFTVNVSQKSEPLTATASTTNPAKIRGALTPPQRVWSLRKSHMAVRDVDVGQDGSIIICTDSGSVWRRVKRAKIKDANAASAAEYKPKDYKFSRVPGLTRIAAVRSNTFGAYAAVRRDCDVLKTQIEVESPTLWKDLYPLHPLQGLSVQEDSDTESPAPRFWISGQPANDIATISRAVLRAPNVEKSLMELLAKRKGSENATGDIRIGSTTSDMLIPVHEFLISGRSTIVRRALAAFRETYFFNLPEVMTIEYDSEGKVLILFQGVDCITIIDLVLYMYTDSMIDVWHHIRHAPKLAVRYRQIRTELMRLAAHLDLRNLEQAVRVMVEPPRTLNQDMDMAIRYSEYFEHGDVEVELDGSSVRVHSALVCQRCPFFEGLFKGRAAGQWLSTRREQAREPQEAIKVDLKHVTPEVFRYVLRHIYADIDEEIFDEVVAADLDAFLDLVMEVMSVANELMLDRLAQCCQKMLGQFVNTRNVCQLLDAVAPCSVTEFKDAALEYICLNLEGMLENHLLGELDDDLMLELDEVVRQNQLACLPFAKSGRAEADLHEQYPELAGRIERGRIAKVDSMALKSRLHEDEIRFTSSSKTKAIFANDPSLPLSGQKTGRKSLNDRAHYAKSPSLKAKNSAADLMFEMDEGDESDTVFGETDTPTREHRHHHREDEAQVPSLSLPADEPWLDSKGMKLPSETDNTISTSTSPWLPNTQDNTAARTLDSSVQADNAKPWASSALASSKLDMKDIMAQASSNRVSNISSGLSLRAQHSETAIGGLPNKLSQRERKKQQSQISHQQQSTVHSPALMDHEVRDKKSASPWQIASRGARISLKDVLSGDNNKSPSSLAENSRTSSIPSLTLRQTVPGNLSSARRVVSGDPKPQTPPQHRSVSTPNALQHPASSPPPTPGSASRSASATQNNAIPTPRSIRHAPVPSEPSLQLSMADILFQQQAQKDIIKEAAAKRSLQEIQEEQAFQEWWDEESRKVIKEKEEEEAKKGRNGGSNRGRGKGMGRGRGRGGARPRGKGRGGEVSESGEERSGPDAGR